MSAPSYLSSFLWSQQQRGPEAFAAKFPGEWLVWEPGPWRASPRGVVATMYGSMPTPAPATPVTAPRPGDALCFLLGLATGRTLDVGRNPDSAIVINDGTVSRQHVLLEGRGSVWWVRVSPGRTATLLGQALSETGQAMAPGAVLQLGGVTLSFHDTASLLARLKNP